MQRLLAVARNQPEAIAQHQQAEDHDRQHNAPGQCLDRAVADALVAIQEEKARKTDCRSRQSREER